MPLHSLQPILVAEDDPNDMFLFTRLLKAAGAINSLHVALDGPEAIRLLSPLVARSWLVAKPTVAFLDSRMPQCGGLEVLAWMRGYRVLDDIPVVIMAGAADEIQIKRAGELGAQCYLIKFPGRLAIARILESAALFNGRDSRFPFETVRHSRSIFDLPENLLRQPK